MAILPEKGGIAVFMNDDTIKLLRECNSGIKMGVSSLEEVIGHVKDAGLKNILEKSKSEHENLGNETHRYLTEYNDDGKDPASVAKLMSWLKTNVKLSVDNSDEVVADLIADGCAMGVKSLYKYLHQYPAAEEKVKELTKKIIKEESDLLHYMYEYL